MDTIDFTKAFKTATGLSNVYPNTLPEDKNSCTGVFTYGGSADKYLAIGGQKLQFICADLDRQAAEATANVMMGQFRAGIMQMADIKNHRILNIDLLQISPMYMGKDEQARFRFSFNIEVQIQIHN